jgi:hypothetical protein
MVGASVIRMRQIVWNRMLRPRLTSLFGVAGTVDITCAYMVQYEMVQYEVCVMLNDLDTVIHMNSTTYDSSTYKLTFW